MIRPLVVLLFVGLLTAYQPVSAQEQKAEKIALLLDRSPQQANTIGYVNLASLTKLMADAGFAPQNAENVVDYWFISDLDLGRLKPRWEAGYATIKQPVTAADLAQQMDGYVDVVDGTEAVWSPRETYLVPVGQDRLGVLRPANRKLLSDWITPRMKVNYSDFLTAEAKQPDQYLSLMIAVDVANVFSPVLLEQRIADFRSLKSVPAKTVASILGSVQGISIIVGRKSLSECIVAFEFGKSPAGLQLIAPELLEELLRRNGTAASEVQQWKASVKGNRLQLQGAITESTLASVLGLFTLQSQADQSLNSPGQAGKQEQQAAYQTKNYFDQVLKIVEQTRTHKSQTTGALAKWNDQRARQIDELGTLNVDSKMIEFGATVASLLRGNALTVRSGNIEAGKTKASQTLSYGTYGDGYYDLNTTSDYWNVTGAYARGNAYADYHDVLNQIDRLIADTRREMTAQFQIQF